MSENNSIQLDLISSAENHEVSTELLVPFAIANFARVLASCFLGGTATGFNRTDAQSRSNDWLVAFESCVPSWALEECAADGGVPVIVHLSTERLDAESHEGYLKVPCPLSTRLIKRISFENEDQLSEATARLSRFPDVPWSLLTFDVQPSLFESPSENDDKTERPKPGVDNSHDKLNRSRLERIGGVVASQLGLISTSSVHDEVFPTLYRLSIRFGELGLAIYNTVVPELVDDSADQYAWNSSWEYLSTRDISHGFNAAELLAHVRIKTEALEPGTARKVEDWVSFCEEIVSASRELPRQWKDSENPAMRAVLLFLLTNSHERLRLFLSDHDAGPRVTFLAMSLAGEFETIKRFKKEEIAFNREALDNLSDLVIGISQGKPQNLSIDAPVFIPVGNFESTIRYEGRPLVIRKEFIDPVFPLLFAKAHQFSLIPGYDKDKKLFYIQEQVDKSKKQDGLRLFIHLEKEEATKRPRRVRFIMPVMEVSNKRAPQAKKLKVLLESAWQQELAVGIYKEGDKDIVAYFSMQMPDTFDTSEFEFMISRFRNVDRGRVKK